MSSLADLRREYASRALTEADAHEDPIQQFSLWFGEALKSELLDTNAMSLATATRAGEPSARIVLLKGFDEAGFVFFTNYESAKGRILADNPRASLLIFWAALERQVRITGTVTKTSAKESETLLSVAPIREPDRRVGVGTKPHRRRIAPRSSPDTQSWRQNMPVARCRCRRSGAGTAWRQRRSNSGRDARAGCTIDCCTRDRATAHGRDRDWRPNVQSNL